MPTTKASIPHKSNSMGGKTHFDVYRVNSQGKRNAPHKTDIKISGTPKKPSVTDVHKPKTK